MEKDVIGECPVCGINVYNNPTKNRPFEFRGKMLNGYPSVKAMPCGLKAAQCPFETPRETADTEKEWLALPAPGNSNYA